MTDAITLAEWVFTSILKLVMLSYAVHFLTDSIIRIISAVGANRIARFHAEKFTKETNGRL